MPEIQGSAYEHVQNSKLGPQDHISLLWWCVCYLTVSSQIKTFPSAGELLTQEGKQLKEMLQERPETD